MLFKKLMLGKKKLNSQQKPRIKTEEELAYEAEEERKKQEEALLLKKKKLN